MTAHLEARRERLDKLEAYYAKKIFKLLMGQLEASIALYKAGGSIELVTAHIHPNEVQVLLSGLYRTVIEAEARIEYRHLLRTEQKAILPVDEWIRRAKNFISTQIAHTIKGINSTSKKQIKQVLQQSIEAGNSIPETSKLLRERVGALSKTRATSIARTEVVAAQNYGSLVGAETTGIKLDKLWIATGDGKTRESHIEANGQTVAMAAEFSVGGEKCGFPGDPGLSPAERVRCRCTIGYKKRLTTMQGTLDL